MTNNTLYKQPSAAPTRKVTAAGVGALVATVLAGVLTALQVPVVDRIFGYPGFETALGGLIAAGFAYYAKERT